MNDFTKEDLKELLYGLYCRAKNDGLMVNQNLYEKIQSMIDNYCSHDFYLGGCGNSIFAQCHKCGIVDRVKKDE